MIIKVGMALTLGLASVVRFSVRISLGVYRYVIILFCRAIVLFLHYASIFRIPQFRIIPVPSLDPIIGRNVELCIVYVQYYMLAMYMVLSR